MRARHGSLRTLRGRRRTSTTTQRAAPPAAARGSRRIAYSPGSAGGRSTWMSHWCCSHPRRPISTRRLPVAPGPAADARSRARLINIRIGGLEIHETRRRDRRTRCLPGSSTAPVADIAPDDLHGAFNGAQHVGELLEVRAPPLPGDFLRCDCHIARTVRPSRRTTTSQLPVHTGCAGTIVA